MIPTRDSVREHLQGVFRDVFEDDSLVISDETTAREIPDWDSITHITLVVAAERAFSIQLRAAEVGKLGNVGQMVDLLLSRIGTSWVG